MAATKTLRAELDEIKAELSRMKQAQPQAEAAAAPSAAGGLGDQIADLNKLVQQMLEDAEETIADHPVATVAGALALGIIIGRLTSH